MNGTENVFKQLNCNGSLRNLVNIYQPAAAAAAAVAVVVAAVAVLVCEFQIIGCTPSDGRCQAAVLFDELTITFTTKKHFQ